MQNLLSKKILLLSLFFLCTLLTACGLFDKDNTPTPNPLVKFTEEVHPHLLWSTSAGSGSNGEYLRMGITGNDALLFTASAKGIVSAIDKSTGKFVWQTVTNIPITTAPGAANGLVVVASRYGDVVAMHQINGNIRWKVSVPGEILATPAISSNVVIVKSIDGTVHGLARSDGHLVWKYTQTEPSLILRGSSAPVVRDNFAFVGFANGTLSKLNVNSGDPLWTQTIAFPEGAFSIQRMIDIDADPIIFNRHLYAATYQGKIASLDWNSGERIWSHDISSYTGMVADQTGVYISDTKSYLWSFQPQSGDINWQQMKLYARIITAPVIMGNYIVVGDAQGYLHWLNKIDGHFAGRTHVGNALYATPFVQDGVLYALTNKGQIFAYTLG